MLPCIAISHPLTAYQARAFILTTPWEWKQNQRSKVRIKMQLAFKDIKDIEYAEDWYCCFAPRLIHSSDYATLVSSIIAT